jgi:hypothetical protein
MAKDRTDSIIGSYEQHPVAVHLMPGGMDEPEFTAFCEDVAARGIIMPVTIYEGKVLDGWHRYRAAHKTGTPFKTIEYTGKDPAGYIASVNVLRRKLSSLQRCLVAARLHLDHGLSQRDACRKLGVSNEPVTLVLKALASKNSKMVKRIEDDSDFTRGMLKEELADAGLLRTNNTPAPAPGPNSVFQAGQMASLPDTNGSGEPEEEGEDDADALLMGKGLKSDQRASKKPKASAAQALADQFKALMADEKATFLTMIWPEALMVAKDAGLILPAAKKAAAKK